MLRQFSGARVAGRIQNKLEYQVELIWGSDNVWLPSPTLWVQYEPDLGERSIVDFEKGKARVQIFLSSNDDPSRETVLAHLKQGVGNLILRKPEDPVEMMKARDSKFQPPKEKDTEKIDVPPGKEIRVYIVKKGDSLWKISRRFGMKTNDLAKLNKISKEETLHVGRPMKVCVFVSHDLKMDSNQKNSPENPMLLDQIRMVDGRPVHRSMVHDFAEDLLDKKSPEVKIIKGKDGIERLVVSIEFDLVSDHVEVRARKFYPIVLKHTEKNMVDPAIVMAIIHTESVFNPMARSRIPAYGLMQLVPHGGGLEAYTAIYDEAQKLTPQYLYDPENNIELGTAYYKILKNRYMGGIDDPLSRSYCAVAAYNAGASNVGYAFISKKSIKRAIPKINHLESQEVYQSLINKLPFKESRNYVRKVYTRTRLYRDWN